MAPPQNFKYSISNIPGQNNSKIPQLRLSHRGNMTGRRLHTTGIPVVRRRRPSNFACHVACGIHGDMVLPDLCKSSREKTGGCTAYRKVEVGGFLHHFHHIPYVAVVHSPLQSKNTGILIKNHPNFDFPIGCTTPLFHGRRLRTTGIPVVDRSPPDSTPLYQIPQALL